MTRVIAIVLGLVVVALVLQDAFEVMLLPRRVHRRLRLVRYYFEAGWQLWSRAAGWLPAGTRREHFLSLFGALSMVLLFLLWATALITGFGLVDWALQNPRAAPLSPLPEQLYMSGATFFTLGYGDIVPRSPAARVLSVVEAGTGFGFIAVVIGYLPVLYQLFSRREAHVIQLDGRAGSPPTASTMLSRHAESLGQLDRLLREWEVWASDLLESHLSYPMLVYYRSQHDNQSWLAALTALMDTCALILVGIEGLPPLQARMTFTMARQVVVEMARSLGAKPSPYTGGDRLAPADCRKLAAVLQAAGVRWAGGAEAERTLAALRATYEPLLQGLAVALLLPLPGWIAAEDAIDHWHEGHRGRTAGRLIEELSERPARPAA